jgi:hypothetical protein
MNHRRNLFLHRMTIVCGSMLLAIFTSAPIFAQQKPMVIDTASSTVKAQTIINKPGSYILNKNITNGQANKASVAVTASNVTIDLQGFVISSTVATNAAAIDATGQSNVVIRNGTITGFAGPAIIAGNNASISAITATGNGSGFTCGTGCLVSNNVISGNTGAGLIFADTTSGYLGNVLQNNNGNSVGAAGQVTGGTSLNQNLCNGTVC